MLTAGLKNENVSYTSFESADDQSTSPSQVPRSMGCNPSQNPGGTSTWTVPPESGTFSGGMTGSYYLVIYGGTNAARYSNGDARADILSCMFGDGRATDGRMLKVGGSSVVFNPSNASEDMLIANPVWDTDLSDGQSNVTLTLGGEYDGFKVGVAVQMSQKTGHLDGDFGATPPEADGIGGISTVNTVNAWWQNDCPFGVSCGVSTTRGSVAEALYGFDQRTEQEYGYALGGFGDTTS